MTTATQWSVKQRHAWLDAVIASDLPPGRKVVATYLMLRTSDHGECFPSIETIARVCRLTPRAVRTSTADLTNRELLGRELRGGRVCSGGRNRCNLYRLIEPQGRNVHSPLEVTTGTLVPPQGGNVGSVRAEPACAQGGNPGSPRTVKRTSHEHGAATAADAYASKDGGGGPELHIAEPGTDAVRVELATVGIEGRKLKELAGADGVTVGLIQDIAGQAQARSLGPGWIVRTLQERAPDNANAIRRRAAQQQQAIEQRAEFARQRSAHEEETERHSSAVAVIEGAAPAAVQAALEELKRGHAGLARVNDPCHPACAQAIAEKLQAMELVGATT